LSLRDRVKSLRLPERAPQKRSFMAAVPWVLCFICLIATIAMAMRQPKPVEEDKSPGETSLSAISISNLRPGEAMLESKGYLVPIRKIQVSPKVGGMVLELKFKEGMVVEIGTILAKLEDVDYKADLDRQRGMAEAARQRWKELSVSLEHQIQQAKADLEDAVAQYNNEYVQLQSEIASKEATAVVDVQKRKATVQSKAARIQWQKNQVAMIEKGTLAAKVAASKAELDQYEADLVKANWRWENCIVRAPLTGIILTKSAEEGSLVNPSAYSNGLSASLCDMADLTLLEVDLSIPERDVARIVRFRQEHPQSCQKCQVRADAFSERVYDAWVSRIMPTADRAKGAVPVRVQIRIPQAEAGVYLRPDMMAAVTFLNAESSDPDARIALAHAQRNDAAALPNNNGTSKGQ
jgi:multidrug efflux pump subunit AcrA (membrane-fusion protein)